MELKNYRRALHAAAETGEKLPLTQSIIKKALSGCRCRAYISVGERGLRIF